ncbi:MAG: MATE family efflux transporter [Proteobacteria bacterium]|nr:MATE family efflux transporter [Pseudomonadota bacterium]
MQLVDLLFCRDLGSVASATVGTASTFFAWFMVIGIGIWLSLEFLIPHALGGKEEKKAGEYFYSGVALSLFVTLVSIVAMDLLTRSGSFYGMNPEIAAPVERFSRVFSLSFLPTFLIPILRIQLQARGRPHDTTWGFALGNLMNVFLNWALIFGHAGFPALGVMGSAYSTLFSRLGILAFLLIRLRQSRDHGPPLPALSEVKWKLRLKTIIRMGLNTSFQMLFEIGAFVFVSTMASKFATPETAAHTVVLTLASFTFMLPAGMGSAAALTMSHQLGAKRPHESVKLGDRTLLLGVGYALLTSLTLLIFRRELMACFTQDEKVIEVGASLLLIAAVFQVGDTLQVILSGCIRGFGETKVQAHANAIGHVAIGLPVGILLGFYRHQGIHGLWIGLCAGLFSVALILGRRYHLLSRAHLKEPVAVSSEP